MITELSAISLHLARMNPASGLLGATPFQEAQVNSWVNWAQSVQPSVTAVSDVITGKTTKFDTKVYNEDVNKVKAQAIALSTALKGKKFLVGDKVTVADLVCAWTLMPAFQLILDAGFRKGKADVAAWFDGITHLPEFKKTAGHVKTCAKAMKPPGDAKAAPAKAPAPAKKEEKDEMDDLFGSDDEDDAAAAKAAAAAAKAAKAGKDKKKKVVIAMSLVMLEVKPMDDQVDLDALAPRIFKEITQDGLFWKTEYKKVPVAFGIFKLIIGFSCEDEKTSVDDIVEKIEAMDDMV